MKQICLYHHLGMGDMFICNGMVNHFAERYKVFLPCKVAYLETIKCLYQDQPLVEVFGVKNEPADIELFARAHNAPVIRIGFSAAITLKNFDRKFYHLAGLDFSLRYSKFKLPAIIKNADALYNRLVRGDYCFIHNEASDSVAPLKINTDLQKIYMTRESTNNLMEYINIIKGAKEIHCVDSSVFQLVDSITVNARLFFHNTRLPNDSPSRVSNKWTIVNY